MAEEEGKAAESGAEEGEEDAVQKKGGAPAAGNNQKFVMIVLILNAVVLIVVAVLAVISIKKQSQEVSLADVAASEKEEGEHGAKEGEHGAKEGEKGKEGEGKGELDNFIKESFTVNLADSKGAHFAQVVIEIEVSDEKVKQAVETLRPKIRDFIVVVLSSKTYEQVSSVDGREFLREEIRNKINGHLTRGQIKEVHFTQFIVQ